ncbi:hypothetical protein RB595_009953 [Gaeumannomyces hyphopodioides]
MRRISFPSCNTICTLGTLNKIKRFLRPPDLTGAWMKTWSVGNSIILSAAIHEAFDQRLLAIHPNSHLIRVFAPYDLITPYHGRKAYFGRGIPDSKALRWHWDVCVIENMGAMTEPWQQDLVLFPWGTGTTPPSRPYQRDAGDENDDGSNDGESMGRPSASARPANRDSDGGRKRSRLSELRGRGEDAMPDLSHREGSSPPSFAECRQQGSGGATKRQRTEAWLNGIRSPCEKSQLWIPSGPPKAFLGGPLPAISANRPLSTHHDDDGVAPTFHHFQSPTE